MPRRKMPKADVITGPIKSVLDQSYADAMENLAEGMKKAAIQGLFSPTDVERNFGLYKRTVRMLMSQGDNFIVDFFNKVDPKTLTDPKIAKDFATTVANKLGGFDQQKAMNYAAGIIEGHHGVSVDSIFAAAKHLPMKDRLEFIRTLSNEYGVSGTVGGDMYPLSRFAHQGKGTGSVVSKASAHTTANPLELAESKGFPVNTGTWSREFDFSNITDPRKLADAFMQQSGFPQMAMADKAFDSPEELGIRKELAEKLGIRERDLYAKSKDFNPRGQDIQKRIKDLGIDVAEIVHRHYGLPYTPRAPLVKDPNAPKRAPKSKVTPTFDEASQFAKGWFDEVDFLPNQVPTGQLMPNRKALRAMAAAGIAAPSLLGTAASAAETTGRVQLARQTGNPVDWIQAGLAGASSAGDLAGYTGALAIPGEVVSTAADLANVAIDTARMPAPRPTAIPQAQTRQRTATAARTQGQVMPKAKPMNLANEGQYFIVNPIRSAFGSIFGKREI